MRLVTQHMADLLKEHAEPQTASVLSQAPETTQEQQEPNESVPDSRYFVFAEEVTLRTAWCPTSVGDRAKNIQLEAVAETDSSSAKNETIMSIPTPLPPRKTLAIPFANLAAPVENALFAINSTRHDLDDHDQSLPQLIYHALLSLPSDARSVCMARIIITGGGSHIPGLKTRLLNDLKSIVESRGWDGVYGKIADERRERLKETNSKRRESSDAAAKDVARYSEPLMTDELTEKIEKEKIKRMKVAVAGEIRGVETLGAWAGGSLVAGLKVKGVVEIERDTFLSNGLGGARRESEMTSATQRMSLGARGSLDSKTGWTLGAWA
ncbi:MAG: hypothetical protein Q9212_005029 [Teloschistes hypoglaucus]